VSELDEHKENNQYILLHKFKQELFFISSKIKFDQNLVVSGLAILLVRKLDKNLIKKTGKMFPYFLPPPNFVALGPVYPRPEWQKKIKIKPLQSQD